MFLREKSGFDAIVSNPPFLGGYKIGSLWGDSYRKYLQKYIADGKKGGQCDLVAYFFLRISELLHDQGYCGLVATNTISQGDTREVGLDQLLSKGGMIIYRGVSSAKWEGSASLEVSHLWLTKDKHYRGEIYLDGKRVKSITSYLTPPGRVTGHPHRLVANLDKSFKGSCVYGTGFILTPEEAESLIQKDPRNKLVLYPYLGGEDLNTHPEGKPSRWVINFHDWELSPETDSKGKGGPYASDFPDCLEIVERLVKPEREKVNRKIYSNKWWQFAEKQPSLYQTIAPLKRVLIRSRISNTNAITFVPTDIIMSEATVIFAFDDYANFAILQSHIHTEWVVKYASTMRKDIRYTPSDCFETFPFPQNPFLPPLAIIGEKYYTHRQQIMLANQEGLTKTYNRFHDVTNKHPDILELRNLTHQLDREVLIAYGWEDIQLNYDWYETKQGYRYTISPEARQEILDRLLELNHQLYEEEVATGKHHSQSRKRKKS